ncbi:hypothetical protein [Chromobacterium violaceum]|uniref:Uncharacterized protein n=1 Tax=Chromobacterium violaceum TaxID=536 RepID=A0AAX2MDW7_CHRVL|nr:hypothetical protein [Chromobacterium violaceum]MCD0492826.1 hypothetical protein [Chromobacterium violaceum]OLZ81089.1 hypothetical protein BS642_09030 [Chromobacterium violaceum]STB70329.1 Uncharacterised protein [Chromobacterium violaceum]SUX34979.1 Uncharacterised protein [Chromobacterium violaceum]
MSKLCSTALAGFMLASSLAGHAGQVFRIDGDSAAPITLRGTVIGPVRSGSKAEGTFFQAYHLKLDHPLRLDDGAACGEQQMRSLALSQEDMARLKGRAVTVRARAFCQEDRAGSYRLADITVLRTNPPAL